MIVNQKLITIVIPVYKVEQYINKCLDSLLVPEKQIQLLEVIIVNDGTPDNSANIAKGYEKKFPSVFRVVDKENGGHGSAWNRGLKEATGKYIKFLDSDDWFDTIEFSRLISKLEMIDADIILCNYNRVDYQTGEAIEHLMYSERIDQTFPIVNFDWRKLSWERFNFWGCTYRTSMLQKEYPLFMERVFYDDAILFIAPVFLCSTIHVYSATIYNYLIGRPGQTMAPEIKRRNLLFWVKTHFHVFDFGLNHYYPTFDQARKQYLAEFYKEWIQHCMVRLVEAPYSICKSYSRQCYAYYVQYRNMIPDFDFSSKTIRLFNKLPFPLYFISRRILNYFIKDDSL